MNGAMQPIAQAFRRAALPLGWYYLVTLGLPLANGAAQSGAGFVNHAVVVIVVPPILIMLLGTIQTTAQLFAAACRSVLVTLGRFGLDLLSSVAAWTQPR